MGFFGLLEVAVEFFGSWHRFVEFELFEESEDYNPKENS